MDTQKIGRFLKELRKQNNMTQEQLGEKLGVTNKTISRWETGNYLPPIECLKLLSDIYQISINEILICKRLDENEYKEASEDNIAAALGRAELVEKSFETKMFVLLMGITTALAIAIILLLSMGNDLSATEIARKIIIIILVVGMVFISNTLNIMVLVLRMKK